MDVTVKMLRSIEVPGKGLLNKNEKHTLTVAEAMFLVRRGAAELLTPIPQPEPIRMVEKPTNPVPAEPVIASLEPVDEVTEDEKPVKRNRNRGGKKD